MRMETTATQKFIEDALSGGWKEYETGNNTVSYYTNTVVLNKVLLDPLAWQAVGKTRGWVNAEVQIQKVKDHGKGADPRYTAETHTEMRPSPVGQWHRFIDHLADGKSVEEALSAIT